MLLLSIPSGLSGLTADLREFLTAVRFARAEWLWLLLVLPLLALVNRWSARRRRLLIARVGRPAAVAAQLTHPISRRRVVGLAYPLAWIALLFGLAGPRWGKSEETGIAVGRDVMIVIDLSRSMQAADMADPSVPTRWQVARAGALDLLAGIARRGGHRVGVVVFAAHPKLTCPLTTDYDHVRAVIDELDGLYPPPEIRPRSDEEISGTRIGAALKAAVEAHDKRFPGYQDIILISDGDDPADDKEWVRGADEARKAEIPVISVGVGDPFEDFILALGNELAPTHLREEPLMEIAAQTGGRYLASRRAVPQLGEFFHTYLEPLPSRSVTEEALPLLKERYGWFLAPALCLFLISWLWAR